MGEPARRGVAGPGAPGWGDVRRQMMACAQACTAAVIAYLAAGGDAASPPAVMAVMGVSALQDLGGVARSLDFGEAVVEAERARAVAEDRAAFPRGRGGHLRAVT